MSWAGRQDINSQVELGPHGSPRIYSVGGILRA